MLTLFWSLSVIFSHSTGAYTMNKNIKTHLNADEETRYLDPEGGYYEAGVLYGQYQSFFELHGKHRYLDDRDRYGNDWQPVGGWHAGTPDSPTELEMPVFDGDMTASREEPLNQMNVDWFDKNFPSASSRRKRYTQNLKLSEKNLKFVYNREYSDAKDSVNEMSINFFIPYLEVMNRNL